MNVIDTLSNFVCSKINRRLIFKMYSVLNGIQVGWAIAVSVFYIFLCLSVIRCLTWWQITTRQNMAVKTVLSWLRYFWCESIITVAHLWIDTRIVLCMDISPEKLHSMRNAVIMSNHQLYCDWLFLWQLSYHFKRAQDFVFILKEKYSIFPSLVTE